MGLTYDDIATTELESGINELFSQDVSENENKDPLHKVSGKYRPYLEEVLKHDLNRTNFVQTFRNQYWPGIFLPPVQFPNVAIKGSYQNFEESFKFPDWFLLRYWEIDQEKLDELRFMACDKLNKDVWDNVFEQQEGESTLELISSIKAVLGKLICMIIYCIETKISSKPFSVRGLLQANKDGVAALELSGDLFDVYNVLSGKGTSRSKFLKDMNDFSEQMNKFLGMPTHMFAKYPRNVTKCEQLLEKFMNYYNNLSKSDKLEAHIPNGLYTALNMRITNIKTTELEAMSRQEPFLVFIRGPGGIGKTQFVRHLIHLACKQLGFIHTESVIEITADNKYWPPLSNQEIAFFDEACSRKEIKDDLLFGNLKSICSPAFFNAAGADIQHKINPFTSKIIFATSNVSFDDLSSRVTNLFDTATWPAMCRRMIIVDAKRNPTFGNYDFNNPQPSDFDPENFSHLELTHYLFKDGKLRPNKTLNMQDLAQMIFERETRMAQEFNTAMMKFENQSATNHLSIVLHGRMGQGKTHAVHEIRHVLSNGLHMPITIFTDWNKLQNHSSKQREIVVIDDLVRKTITSEQEDILMDFFNQKLTPNSIIIFTTNVSPSFKKIAFSKFGLTVENKFPFQNDGLVRRIGYQGYYGGSPLPNENMEFFVNNFKYYKMDRSKSMTYLDPFVTNGVEVRIAFWTLLLLTTIFIHWSSFIVFLSAYYWYGLYSSKQECITTDLPELIFNAYKVYLMKRKNIAVEYVDSIHAEGHFDLLLYAQSSRKMFTGSGKEFLDKIHIDRTSFNKATQDWKIYVDDRVATFMQKNMERFVICDRIFTEELVIGILSRYVNAFIEMGITPRFNAHIEDLGYFLYENNLLMINRTSGNVQAGNCVHLYEQDGKLLVANGTKDIPVVDLLESPNKIYETFDCTLPESLQLKNFMKSQEFVLDSRVLKLQRELVMIENEVKLKQLMLNTRDGFNKFIGSTIGKIVLILFMVYSSVKLFKFVKSFLTSGEFGDEGKKTSRKGSPKRRNYDTDDDIEQHGKKTSRKGSPKRRNYDTDDDIEQHGKKTSRKGSPKRRNYDTDDDVEKHEVASEGNQLSRPVLNKKSKIEAQDVLTLSDMNNYASIKPRIEIAEKQCRQNLAQVYWICSKEESVDIIEDAGAITYGLFIANNVFVTVGHIVNKCDKDSHLYVRMDGWKNYRKLHLVKKFPHRDLSVWYVNGIQQQKDITRLFFRKAEVDGDEEYNACISRFGPNKSLEYHTGKLLYRSGTDIVGKQSISEYASLHFGQYNIKLTTRGDCGLPYYSTERLNPNKIYGIHCMGNAEYSEAIGIGAMIFQEDISDFKKCATIKMSQYESLSGNCWRCENKLYGLMKDDNPKVKGHMTLWHKNHGSNMQSAIEEIGDHQKLHPGFKGIIIKNSGQLYGTQKHSHTQFLPVDNIEFPDVTPWRKFDLTTYNETRFEHLGEGRELVIDTNYLNLPKLLKKYKILGETFRLKIFVYQHPKIKIPYCRIQIITTKENLNDFSEEMNIVAFPSEFGAPIHVPEDVCSLLNGAKNNLERGKLEDIPFRLLAENETVKVIGSFVSTKSHIPSQKYKQTPFSKAVEKIIPIEKLPTEFDIGKIPQEELDKMALDMQGNPSQLATQALSWAHKIFGDKNELRDISIAFKSKVLRYYSGMRILTDDEVLGGLAPNEAYSEALRGMELDASIGFTLRELFYVTKKSDVITVDEEGKYSWLNNPAADRLKEMYTEAKRIQDAGDKYLSVFTEMLKMEKLKTSKRYIGRTFVAQDILGVMMERRALGFFAAKATKSDPNCGVGTDPAKDFHAKYLELIKHPNLWAGDYKKFDRSIPAIVMYEIRDLLCEANPSIRNQIYSAFTVMIERIQVTGKTLSEVFGGLPSGCFNTASFNSLINEYILFASFYTLCQRNNMAVDFKIYDTNTTRFFYGDDVIISVSNEYSDLFNRENVSRVLKELFGMTLDSSAKDGKSDRFDTFESASWISRFFRQLGDYPLYAGALKKISINANFHYVTSLNLSHMGSLLDKAQYEAAFWDDEYYEQIQRAIRICLEMKPKLGKYVQLISLDKMREDIFVQNRASAYAVFPENNTSIPIDKTEKWEDWNDMVDREKAERASKEQSRKIIENISFFQKYRFENQYFKHVIYKKQTKYTMTYRMRLNELFQVGKVIKPTYKYERKGLDHDLEWTCELNIGTSQYKGLGRTKSEASEEAAYKSLLSYVEEHPCEKLAWFSPLKESNLSRLKFEQQMFVSPKQAVPQAPLQQTDVSVVSDSGLFTNTAAPSPARILNQTAMALDNPSGSGAPFSKHVSVYNIYQRWNEKNTVINPSLATGTEILRISLDPNDLPERIKDYVMMHEAIVPSIEVVIAIAGASGTIGWLVTGWVPDASPDKEYSLDDLQQISAETTNMNGTQIIKIQLDDVRKSGLYRDTENDPEPYPGIILMVDQAVVNVQRNDAINYPVRVQVRLSQNCVLMKPFKTGSSPAPPPPSGDQFDLGSYFYKDRLDFLILTSSVPNLVDDPVKYDDCGYSTKDFRPKWKIDGKVLQVVYDPADIVGFTKDDSAPASLLSGLEGLDPGPGVSSHIDIPAKFRIGFGSVSKLNENVKLEDDKPPKGTVYEINYGFYMGLFRYTATKLYAQEEGCIIECELSYDLIKDQNTKSGKKRMCVFTRTTDDTTPNIDQKSINNGPYSNDFTTAATYSMASEHNNVIEGDDFNYGQYSSGPMLCGSEIKEFSVEPMVATGNSMPGSNLDNGLKRIVFTRSGTSATINQDVVIVPIVMPILTNAIKAFNKQFDPSKQYKMDLVIAGQNMGEIGYENGIFVIRTDEILKVKAGISNDIMLTNIVPTNNLKGLQIFNSNGFASWTTTSKETVRRNLKMVNFECQAAMSGAVLTGVGQGMSNWAQQLFQQQMLEKVLANQRVMQDANNAALQDRQKALFQQNLQLKGYSSASAQSGMFDDGTRRQLPTYNESMNHDIVPFNMRYDGNTMNNGGGGMMRVPKQYSLDQYDPTKDVTSMQYRIAQPNIDNNVTKGVYSPVSFYIDPEGWMANYNAIHNNNKQENTSSTEDDDISVKGLKTNDNN